MGLHQRNTIGHSWVQLSPARHEHRSSGDLSVFNAGVQNNCCSPLIFPPAHLLSTCVAIPLNNLPALQLMTTQHHATSQRYCKSAITSPTELSSQKPTTRGGQEDMASSMVDERRGGGGAQVPGRASAAGTTHCSSSTGSPRPTCAASSRRPTGADGEEGTRKLNMN